MQELTMGCRNGDTLVAMIGRVGKIHQGIFRSALSRDAELLPSPARPVPNFSNAFP